MKRLDRAKVIRDQILELPAEHWDWIEVGNSKWRKVSSNGWWALYITPFTPLAGAFAKPSIYKEALAQEMDMKLSLPYRLDLCVIEVGKVLSVEWKQHDIKLISMKRGSWESDLFGIPPRELAAMAV